MELINFQDLTTIGEKFNLKITIGFFDGTHLGHQLIFEKVSSEQKENEKSVVMTFDHKFKIEKQLFPLSEKVNQISKFKIDYLLIFELDEIKNYSKELVLEKIQTLGNIQLYVGSDFRFGKNAQGDIKYLLDNGVNVIVLDYLLNNNERISSTKIREYLASGKIDIVNKYLGYNYYICGEVVHGDQIGTKINFPTANIVTLHFVPQDGVYITKTTIEDVAYYSLTNIGNRPTVGIKGKTIETYIDHNFDEKFYNKFIKVEFIKHLRNEVKFSSLDDLQKQLEIDKNEMTEYFKFH